MGKLHNFINLHELVSRFITQDSGKDTKLKLAAKMIAMLTSSLSALPALGKLFSIDMGIQYVGFTFAWILRTEKFYDLTGILFPRRSKSGKRTRLSFQAPSRSA